jgi:hypothetical protein
MRSLACGILFDATEHSSGAHFVRARESSHSTLPVEGRHPPAERIPTKSRQTPTHAHECEIPAIATPLFTEARERFGARFGPARHAPITEAVPREHR